MISNLVFSFVVAMSSNGIFELVFPSVIALTVGMMAFAATLLVSKRERQNALQVAELASNKI